MPYVSEKQRAYFNANRSKLEKEGVDVDEWNQSSKGMKLPERSHSVHAMEGLARKPKPMKRMRDKRKHGVGHTMITHHEDGSHTMQHSPMDGGEPMTQSAGDNGDMMSKLQEMLGK